MILKSKETLEKGPRYDQIDDRKSWDHDLTFDN